MILIKGLTIIQLKNVLLQRLISYNTIILINETENKTIKNISILAFIGMFWDIED